MYSFASKLCTPGWWWCAFIVLPTLYPPTKSNWIFQKYIFQRPWICLLTNAYTDLYTLHWCLLACLQCLPSKTGQPGFDWCKSAGLYISNLDWYLLVCLMFHILPKSSPPGLDLTALSLFSTLYLRNLTAKQARLVWTNAGLLRGGQKIRDTTQGVLGFLWLIGRLVGRWYFSLRSWKKRLIVSSTQKPAKLV